MMGLIFYIFQVFIVSIVFNDNCRDVNGICSSGSTCVCGPTRYTINGACAEKIPLGSTCPSSVLNTEPCIDVEAKCADVPRVGGPNYRCICNTGFSESAGDCVIKDCGGLNNPRNGAVSTATTQYEGVATYTCNSGYAITGTSDSTTSRLCEASGSWSGNAPTCTKRDCGGLNNPSNGVVSTPTTQYTGIATYTCNSGYVITGIADATTASRLCEASGSWSGNAPTCTKRNCGGLKNPRNGVVSISSTQYEGIATYSCNSGFVITGTSDTTTGYRLCIASGSWSGIAPTCTKRDCGALNNPSNGAVSAATTQYEGIVTYTCYSGYIITGTSDSTTSRLCDASGSWSGSAPTCTKRDCGGLNNPINGVVSTPTTQYTGIATYTCNSGYVITGTADAPTVSRLCEASGSWSGNAPTCTKRECGGLKDPSNGVVSISSTQYEGIATYTCNGGFVITGTSDTTTGSRWCIASGSWSGIAPTCTQRDCGNLSDPQNGVVLYTQTSYQATAIYTCDTGYIIDGTVSSTTTVTCTASGSWSVTKPSPTCIVQRDPIGATCPNPFTTNLSPGDLCDGNNAECLIRSVNSQNNTCQCRTGYYDDNGDNEAGLCRNVEELRVQRLLFLSVTTSEMSVSWTSPTNKENVISGYVVEWRQKGNSIVRGTSRTLTSRSYVIHSGNLVSGRTYIVKVISRNTVSYTSTVQTTSVEKEQALKPHTPGIINTQSSNLDANDQNIYIVLNAQSGYVARYEVTLNEDGTQLSSSTTNTASVLISYNQIKNGHRYNLSVTAVSETFAGSNVVKSHTHTEEIKTVVKIPTEPRSVTCNMTTDTSITIKWESPLIPNGDLIDYRIDTYPLGGALLKTNRTGNLELQYEITGLQPGSYYYFNVFTVNEAYASGPTKLTPNYCATRANRQPEEKSGPNVVVIVVVVVAVVVVALTITLLIIGFVRRRRTSQLTETGLNPNTSDSNTHGKESNPMNLAKYTQFTSQMTSDESMTWLDANDFSNCRKYFKQYTGKDLLNLTKEDFQNICGTADGIRLYNRLQESITGALVADPQINTDYAEKDGQYMDLDDTKRDGVPYENVEMDTSHMYTSHRYPV